METTTSSAVIQRVGDEWLVVVTQASGKPLRFTCDSLPSAERFLAVFHKPSRLTSQSRAAVQHQR